jgi:ribosomal protein S18 acetylase RimI-like enzyme
MSARPFGPVSESDAVKALGTLVLAFAADPVERWMFPEAQHYLTAFPAFLAAFGGSAFAEGTVWSLDSLSAVALWLPPGKNPDGDAIVALLKETLAPEKLEDAFAVLEQMDEAHPTFPHWYLPWFGVDPGLQGQGLGSELMTHCLRRVDEDQLPVYLETPNPRNITFYERHGFDVTGVAQAGAFPPVTFMLRPAR